MPKQNPAQIQDESDFVSDWTWGVAKIAKEIGKTARETNYLLALNLLPAMKIGKQWAARRSVLRNYLPTAVPAMTFPQPPAPAPDPVVVIPPRSASSKSRKPQTRAPSRSRVDA